MMKTGNWRLWTSSTVTPAHSDVIIVLAVGGDVIITWPAGARLIATARHIPAAVAVTLVAPGDVTVADAAAAGGEDVTVDGHVQR